MPPQELHVLRCFECKLFQVHIVKKSSKWTCKVCGERQSLKTIYGRGTGRECRLIVQDLNEQQGTLQRNLLENPRDGEDNIHADVSFKSNEPLQKFIPTHSSQMSVDDGNSKWKSFLPEDEIQNITVDTNEKFNDTSSDFKINRQKIETGHSEGAAYISPSEWIESRSRNNETYDDMNKRYTFERLKKFEWKHHQRNIDEKHLNTIHAHNSRTEENERLMLNNVQLSQKFNVLKKHETYVNEEFVKKFSTEDVKHNFDNDDKYNYKTTSALESCNLFRTDDIKRDCGVNRAQTDSCVGDMIVNKASKWFQYTSEIEMDTDTNKTGTSIPKSDVYAGTRSQEPSSDDIKIADDNKNVSEAAMTLTANDVVNIFESDDSELDFTLVF